MSLSPVNTIQNHWNTIDRNTITQLTVTKMTTYGNTLVKKCAKNLHGLNSMSPPLVWRAAPVQRPQPSGVQKWQRWHWRSESHQTKLTLLLKAIYKLERNTVIFSFFFCSRTPAAIREAKPMTALQPEMEEKSQKGSEGPREVVWPFLFSLSLSLPPLISAVKPPTRSAVLWNPQLSRLVSQPPTEPAAYMQSKSSLKYFIYSPKKAFNRSSPNTPNDWK